MQNNTEIQIKVRTRLQNRRFEIRKSSCTLSTLKSQIVKIFNSRLKPENWTLKYKDQNAKYKPIDSESTLASLIEPLKEGETLELYVDIKGQSLPKWSKDFSKIYIHIPHLMKAVKNLFKKFREKSASKETDASLILKFFTIFFETQKVETKLKKIVLLFNEEPNVTSNLDNIEIIVLPKESEEEMRFLDQLLRNESKSTTVFGGHKLTDQKSNRYKALQKYVTMISVYQILNLALAQITMDPFVSFDFGSTFEVFKTLSDWEYSSTEPKKEINKEKPNKEKSNRKEKSKKKETIKKEKPNKEKKKETKKKEKPKKEETNKKEEETKQEETTKKEDTEDTTKQEETKKKEEEINKKKGKKRKREVLKNKKRAKKKIS